ncbi:hypothetical protein [Bacillus massiliigorillae]|nr:hypothetical protein [Bacillus massiliigorillae]
MMNYESMFYGIKALLYGLPIGFGKCFFYIKWSAKADIFLIREGNKEVMK